MSKKTLHLILATLLIGTFLLTSCRGQPTPTPAPTVDTNLIYTQAAQTIEAGIALTEAARPTNTATIEPTATLEPVATLEPTVTTAADGAGTTGGTTGGAAATATATQQGAVVLPTATNTAVVVVAVPTATAKPATSGGGNVVYPTATPNEPRAEFVSLSPDRGTTVKRNASWDVAVTVKNVGGVTWINQEYYLGYLRGDQMGSPNQYFITKDVKPGESYTFYFIMQAPDSTGGKQVYWVFRGGGTDLMYIDFNVNVTD